MLTISSTTAQQVGNNYGDDEDSKWRGAARKYLATVDGRQYLVKPDSGWPSDSNNERVAAAFYRAMGVPTANVVRATIDGISACAVRIIDGAEPIGDEMASLDKVQALQVAKAAILAGMIGDSDKHPYNFITDGTTAYAIDHGLAFSGSIGKIPWTPAEHLQQFVSAGVLTWDEIRQIVAELPDNTYAMALLAYAHAQRNANDSRIVNGDWRSALLASIDEHAGNDPDEYGFEDSDHDPDWCGTCEPDEHASDAPACNWNSNHGERGHTLRKSTGRWVWRTRKPIGVVARQAELRRLRELMPKCECAGCGRIARRGRPRLSARCDSGFPFHRRISDPVWTSRPIR